MENPTPTNVSSETNINRRELLKVLAASGGGLIAAAFLPCKWMKPVIEAGVLPAHAQATDSLVISQFAIGLNDRQKSVNSTGDCGDGYKGSFNLNDAFGQINNPNAPVFHPAVSADGVQNWNAVAQLGTPYSMPYIFTFESCCNVAFSLYATLNGRTSNTTGEPILNCPNP